MVLVVLVHVRMALLFLDADKVEEHVVEKSSSSYGARRGERKRERGIETGVDIET
jgi:hypothetical protein